MAHFKKVVQQGTKYSLITKQQDSGSGCDPDGRAVASNNRGPRFEINHQYNIYRTCLYCYFKIMKKRLGQAHLKMTYAGSKILPRCGD